MNEAEIRGKVVLSAWNNIRTVMAEVHQCESLLKLTKKEKITAKNKKGVNNE